MPATSERPYDRHGREQAAKEIRRHAADLSRFLPLRPRSFELDGEVKYAIECNCSICRRKGALWHGTADASHPI